jgi:tetratricopeptide (TPR) repeat protein
MNFKCLKMQETPIHAVFTILGLCLKNDNLEMFGKYCDEYKDEIYAHYAEWMTPPESIRKNEKSADFWVKILKHISIYFKSKGNPEIENFLVEFVRRNEIEEFEKIYEEAQALYNQGKYTQSIAQVIPILPELKFLKDPVADDLVAKIHGLMGIVYLRIDQLDESKKQIRLALNQCRDNGDLNGLCIYKNYLNLIRTLILLKKDPDNPLAMVRSELVRAQKLSDKGNYNLSNKVLDGIAGTIENSADPLIRLYLSKVNGLKGLNYYRLGEISLAMQPTELALRLSVRRKDQAGITIYKANLEEIKARLLKTGAKKE